MVVSIRANLYIGDILENNLRIIDNVPSFLTDPTGQEICTGVRTMYAKRPRCSTMIM